MSDRQRALLEQGCEALGLVLSVSQADRLLEYCTQLQRWNRAYNLTAIQDPIEHVSRHLLDSLSLQPHLAGRNCCDVGTGAGLPGLILAIVDPERHWTLIDSAGKRMRFLHHCCQHLRLNNVTLLQTRVEQLSANALAQPDTLCSRAFMNLAGMLEACDRIIGSRTRVLAMKGPAAEQELQALPDAYILDERISIQIPGLAARHEVLRLHRRPVG